MVFTGASLGANLKFNTYIIYSKASLEATEDYSSCCNIIVVAVGG